MISWGRKGLVMLTLVLKYRIEQIYFLWNNNFTTLGHRQFVSINFWRIKPLPEEGLFGFQCSMVFFFCFLILGVFGTRDSLTVLFGGEYPPFWIGIIIMRMCNILWYLRNSRKFLSPKNLLLQYPNTRSVSCITSIIIFISWKVQFPNLLKFMVKWLRCKAF